jgi:site-specific recombinase XerD
MHTYTISDAQTEFLASKRDARAGQTVQWYTGRLSRFCDWLGPDTALAAISEEDLRRYRDRLQSQKLRWEDHPSRPTMNSGLSAQTVHGHLRALRALFHWCVDTEKLAINPFTRFKLPSLGSSTPDAISKRDFQALLKAAKERPRDLAVLLFLGHTGCRVGGLVGLKLADLDIDGRKAWLTEKGDKSRNVFFGQQCADALEDWLKVRPRGGAHVFAAERGSKPLTTSGVHQLIGRLARLAGVTGRCGPHMFRHAAARGWLEAGADLSTVSQLLGHEDIVVTHRFYARWAQSALQRQHDRYNWLETDDFLR